METFNFNNLISFFTVGSAFRIGMILVLLIYVVFAFFIIRQTTLMDQVLHTKISPTFKAFAYLHFIASLLVLITSLMLLTP